MFLSCSDSKSDIEDEEIQGKGILVVNSTEANGTKTSSGTSYELSDLKTAIITIEQNGIVLEGYDAKEVQLQKWGEDNITIKGIELDNGEDYSITEFELKNDDKATTFASPKSGSQAEKWVEQALPIKFDIKANETTQLEIEVVTTLGASPNDFGYSVFAFSDESPKVQEYLENIETIFLNKGERIIHHYTKRGVPTYSEIFRNHIVNTHVNLDYIAETIKHYYDGDANRSEKITIEYHKDSEVRQYNFNSFHASGNIEVMEGDNRIWEFNENGLLIKSTSKNEAGVNDYGSYEYLYNENDYLIERKDYNLEGEYILSYKYTVDNDGNRLSQEKVKANGDILYPKYSWSYTDGKKTGKETVYYDNNKEFVAYENVYEYNANGLLSQRTETSNFSNVIVHTTQFIYDGENLVKSIYTKSDEPNNKVEQYHDALGYLTYGENNKNVYDFRGRLLEKHYQDNDFKLVDCFDMEADLIKRKYYNLNGVLIKTIHPKDRILRKYWSNGRQRTYIKYALVDFIAEEELTEIEVNYKNPKTDKEFELLNYVHYLNRYDENGNRQHSSYFNIITTDDGNYPNGKIIKVSENQYKKDGADYKSIKQTICQFYYKTGTYSYCSPTDLYMYVVAERNLENGDYSIKYYNPDGTEM